MASPSRLHRLNYFDGRLLTAEDFRTEQAYQLGRARRHNRHVHGWGVINGLDVRVVGNFVEVSPGAAIDCAGNELVVENGVALSMPQDARRLVVLMRYVEHGVDPLPTIATDAGAGEALNFSHIEEGCELDLSEDAWTPPRRRATDQRRPGMRLRVSNHPSRGGDPLDSGEGGSGVRR